MPKPLPTQRKLSHSYQLFYFQLANDFCILCPKWFIIAWWCSSILIRLSRIALDLIITKWLLVNLVEF